MKRTKLYKLGNTLLSILIAIGAFYYLVDVLSDKTQELDLIKIQESIKSNISLVLLVIFLMPLNWLFELIKWKMMVERLQEISFSKAAKSIFFGITLALITPNKLGDFGGRLLHIKKGKRWQALYYDSFLSLTQLLVTVVLGIIGGGFYLKERGGGLIITYSYIVFTGSVLLALLLIIVFLSYKVNDTLLKYLPQKFKGRVQLEIDRKVRTEILVLSSFRYLTFATQFYILLWVFDCSITLNHAFIGISTIYLITTVLPTGWISDLVVRTSAAYFIFESMGHLGEAAVLASSLLWFINLFFPAIVGLFNLHGMNWVSLKEELKEW